MGEVRSPKVEVRRKAENRNPNKAVPDPGVNWFQEANRASPPVPPHLRLARQREGGYICPRGNQYLKRYQERTFGQSGLPAQPGA
jgi:hypothetical protein